MLSGKRIVLVTLADCGLCHGSGIRIKSDMFGDCHKDSEHMRVIVKICDCTKASITDD
jgi:hypothetical protein